MKVKKKLLICLLVISILSFGIFSLKPKADSGWDSSYDSGTSWDSGDSWSSDSSWSSSSYSGSGGELSPAAIYITIIIIVIIIIIASRSNQGGSSSNIVNNYNELSDEEIKSFGIDKNSFKKMVFDKYVDIQEAWMNFDYNKLKKNLTDELYNTYMMQLDALKLKNQKNIMSDFKDCGCRITGITEENGLLNVKVYLRVQMFDYVVDEKESVVRGNKNHKIDIEYIITFVKKSSADNKDTVCPNCGAKIEAVASGKCDYCGTVVVVDAKDFVMSKKTCIGQRSL